jgi:hypothetical protein
MPAGRSSVSVTKVLNGLPAADSTTSARTRYPVLLYRNFVPGGKSRGFVFASSTRRRLAPFCVMTARYFSDPSPRGSS